MVTKGIIGVIAECRYCKLRWENYRTGQKEAADHARKTKHHVVIETTYATHYNEEAVERKLK